MNRRNAVLFLYSFGRMIGISQITGALNGGLGKGVIYA